ncbi:multidrug ABC transporter permease [Caulobacter sp. CCUG 60055]|uniref:ABC transporter ATP-binding protein n=1 Tax=Caulobacter sp. CCUG 60055 TaxID=2100090 RepID=UPI001FA741DE|nr:ABC transporter ATP-binding protein [Caulobacter sp. CCUG 60055]MBQ1542405.1 ABC transporter ATP-binding protein [Caulobacteraceae bacterium]MCI3181015.1 multidrug ABC transporter permease [Caulobacter sp. CCUG 60055]
MSDDTPSMTNRALIGRIARTYLAPRWKGFAVAVVSAVIIAILTTRLIGIIQPAVDDILNRHKPGALVVIPLTIAGLALARGLFQVIQANFINRIGNGVVGDVQVQLFGRLVRADLARLRGAHSGAYVSSVLYDAGLIREAATTGVINYTREFLTVVGALWVMFRLDPWLALAILLIGPIASLVMRRFSKRTTKAAKGAMVETSALSTAIMESLDGIKIVKIENREADEEARVAAVVERRQQHLIKGSNARAQAAPATETLMMFVLALVFAYVGWSGRMGSAAFFTFITALGAASQSLRQVANLQTVMAEGLTAARRLFGALDVEPEIRDAAGARPLVLTDAAIRFENVSFSYHDGAPALDGVSLEALRGETVALVGPSGGGKSTILNLIPRFYDVTAGAVTIDGVDIRAVTMASLRDRIALVTQEPFLFDDTVRANIAYARPDAGQEAVEAAARAAAAHDFITALPDGYDTVVGEAGARLSGGQRQRISIARAFLKDAPILLLDEATSALDTESEAQVQAALERLMAGRATLLIAHRLSTVKGADRIYVIDQGKVVETGDHAALMRAQGLYARLARAQDLDHEPAAETVAR